MKDATRARILDLVLTYGGLCREEGGSIGATLGIDPDLKAQTDKTLRTIVSLLYKENEDGHN